MIEFGVSLSSMVSLEYIELTRLVTGIIGIDPSCLIADGDTRSESFLNPFFNITGVLFIVFILVNIPSDSLPMFSGLALSSLDL